MNKTFKLLFSTSALLLTNTIYAAGNSADESILDKPDAQRSVVSLEIKKKLTPEEKNNLLRSSNLKKLKILDLSNQDMTDDDLKALSENPTFSRLLNLGLEDNSNVTEQGIEYLMNSPLGTVRDMRQFSEVYEHPISEINVKINNTGIKDPQAFKNPRGMIDISYADPETGQMTRPQEKGLKKINLIL